MATQRMDQWIRKFSRPIRSSQAKIVLEFRQDKSAAGAPFGNNPKQEMEKLTFDLLKQFMSEKVTPLMKKLYTPSANNHLQMFNKQTPDVIGEGTGPNSSFDFINRESEPGGFAFPDASGFRTVDKAGTRSGHQALIRELQQVRIFKTARGVGAKLGEGVGSLSSNAFSEMPGHTVLDNLFLTVEFGTGVADNVGGERWVKRPGQSPGGFNLAGKNIKEEDGSWWLGPILGQGMHFRGKPGFNGLFEKVSREPKDVWIKLFRTEFPRFINRGLATKIGGLQF